MDSEFSRKKLLVFGALFLVVLAIPLTVYTALQQKDTQTKAVTVPDSTVIVDINGEQITKAQIRSVAEEQNDPSAVDRQALVDALDTLEERKILDIAAQNFNLTIDQDRLDKFNQEGISDTEAKYEALREQVILKAVNSIEALSVGFWNPPSVGFSSLSVDDQTLAATQLSEGIPILDEIENQMNNGEDAITIAESINTSHPDLASVMAVNGYIIDSLNAADKAFASYPVVYEYGDSTLDNQTRDALFVLANNSVKKISNTSQNRGGSVFRIINKGNLNGSSSYDAWLTEQKASLVQEVSAL